METLHMQDVIRLLGLPAPPAGKSSYYIPCPCCDDKPQKKAPAPTPWKTNLTLNPKKLAKKYTLIGV